MSLHLIWSILMAIISVVAITGNVLVMIIIVKNRRQTTPSNVFVCFLAAVDIFCAVVHLLRYGLINYSDSTVSHTECALLISLATVGCGTNLWMIYVISVDRMLAIFKPFQYRTWLYQGRAVRIGIFAILFAVGLEIAAISTFIDWYPSGSCSLAKIVSPSLTLSLTIFSGIVMVQMIVMYVAMFKKAMEFQKSDHQLGKSRKGTRNCFVLSFTC